MFIGISREWINLFVSILFIYSYHIERNESTNRTNEGVFTGYHQLTQQLTSYVPFLRLTYFVLFYATSSHMNWFSKSLGGRVTSFCLNIDRKLLHHLMSSLGYVTAWIWKIMEDSVSSSSVSSFPTRCLASPTLLCYQEYDFLLLFSCFLAVAEKGDAPTENESRLR